MKIQNNPYLTYIDIIHILQNSNMVKQSSFFSSLVLEGGGGGGRVHPRNFWQIFLVPAAEI